MNEVSREVSNDDRPCKDRGGAHPQISTETPIFLMIELVNACIIKRKRLIHSICGKSGQFRENKMRTRWGMRSETGKSIVAGLEWSRILPFT